jgi:hypothetical protein
MISNDSIQIFTPVEYLKLVYVIGGVISLIPCMSG